MTQVVIQDIIPRTQLVAAALQTVFNTNWTADATTDIDVYARAAGVDADDVTQIVSPTDYNVTFIGASQTVRVTFLVGRTLNDIITIVRNTPSERLNLYINTNFVPSMLNQDFGILTLVDQQAQMYDTVVAPHYNVSAIIDVQDKILPILGANQVWRMNSTVTAIEAVEIGEPPPPIDGPYIIYTDNANLPDAQNLGLLTDGLLKQTVVAGVATLAIAVPNVDYLSATPPLGTMAFQNSNNVNITGGVANLTAGQVATTPLVANDLVNKAYADSISAGFTFKSAVVCSTTANLSATYSNGASGVGATLTEVGNGVFTVDGISAPSPSRVLVKNQSTTANNGIYIVTNAGSAGTPYVLTRATDFDTAGEIVPGSIVFVQTGTTLANTSWVETNPVLTVGTDPIVFIQFSQQYPLSMGNGGTGAALTPTVNNLVYSTATTMALLATLASGVLVTSAGGVPSISTTLPAGLTIPGYAHSGANSDITSMTGLTGGIGAPTAILDANGNEVQKFATGVASAVNEYTFTNAATGNAPTIAVTGGDANINWDTSSKGTGTYISRSANLTAAIQWKTGTTYRHTTNWIPADTAQTRNITLQDLDGTMAYVGDAGSVLLATATASSSASIAFTNVTGYTNYMLCINSLLPATNGAQLSLQYSLDNGATWRSTSGDYQWQVIQLTNTTSVLAASSTFTSMPVTGVTSNGAGAGANGFIMLQGLNALIRTGVQSNIGFISSVGPTVGSYGSVGTFVTTSNITAIRLIESSGNIASGTVQLYGFK